MRIEPSEFYISENGLHIRVCRAYNIAVHYLFDHYPNKAAVAAGKNRSINKEYMRRDIRDALKLPDLHDEDHKGDLRATGDAAGEHKDGLWLHADRACIEINEYNLYRCTRAVIDNTHTSMELAGVILYMYGDDEDILDMIKVNFDRHRYVKRELEKIEAAATA